MIEMALVLPLLLMILLGIWTTARAYNVKNTMDHAVREAARYAATVDPWDEVTSPTAVRAVVDQELSAAAIPTLLVSTGCIEKVDAGDAGCAIDGSQMISAAPADLIVISVEYADFPLDFVIFSMDVDLRSTASARYES
jgi:hypothetical protein